MPAIPVGTPNPSVDERSLAQRIASALRATTVRLGYLMLDRLDVSGDISCQNLTVRRQVRHSGEAWMNPTLLNGWVNFGAGTPSAAFRKDGFGWVHLHGLVKNGTVGAAIFVLPVSYRPLLQVTYVTTGGGPAFAQLHVGAAGDVVQDNGTNGQCSLDGISFWAEQ